MQIGNIFILFALLMGQSAYGQRILIDANAFYFQKEEQRSNAAGTQTINYETQYLFLGLGGCYQIFPWCFGLKYLQGDIGSINNNGLLDGGIEFSGLAVSGGYTADNLFLQASLFLNGKKTLQDGTSNATEYPAKFGYMVDLGYGFSSGSLLFGPSIKIFKFTYDERTVSGQKESLSTEESDRYVMPMFSIWTYF